jgi:hypothetical protein
MPAVVELRVHPDEYDDRCRASSGASGSSPRAEGDARTATERLELAPEQLRRRLDPAALPVQTTEDVEPLEATIGQLRAASDLRSAGKCSTVRWRGMTANRESGPTWVGVSLPPRVTSFSRATEGTSVWSIAFATSSTPTIPMRSWFAGGMCF